MKTDTPTRLAIASSCHAAKKAGTSVEFPNPGVILGILDDLWGSEAEAARARAVEAEWLDLARRIMAAAAGHGAPNETPAR